MKLDWRTCLRVGVTVCGIYVFIHYWEVALGVAGAVLTAARPLAVGALLAYLVNILMSFYEKHYFVGRTEGWAVKSRRPVCMLAALLTLILLTAAIVLLVIPELISCVQLLAAEIPGALNGMLEWLRKNEMLSPELVQELAQSAERLNWNEIGAQMMRVLSTGLSGVVGSVVSVVSTTASALVAAFLGIVFAVYLLLGKETLARQCARTLNVYLPARWLEKLFYVLRTFNDCFHRFIVGQCIEAIILGSLCVVGMLVLRLPYAPMIGALVGFTALIPVAGAYIGACVGAFMILTVAPWKSLLFLLFILVLQQAEGNLIYPKVMGKSIGLPGIWVLAAITVGGGLYGVFGMLLGVPLAAACYQLVRADMRRRAASPSAQKGDG